jgi:hypothetical protein
MTGHGAASVCHSPHYPGMDHRRSLLSLPTSSIPHCPSPYFYCHSAGVT